MGYKHYLPILLLFSTFITKADELKATSNNTFICETGLSIVVVTLNPTFCPGEVLELELNGSADPSQYYVHIDGGASFYNGTPSNWSQTVQVQIIDNDFGLIAENSSDPTCPVLQQGFSFQEPTGNLLVPSYDNLVDVNETISLTVTPDYNADVVLWNSPMGGTIIPSGDGSSVSITFETTGSYTVTANASNECGPGPASTFDFTVSLDCETTPVIGVKTPNPTFCAGEVIELELTGSYDPSLYEVFIEGGTALLTTPANWSETVEVQISGSFNAVANRIDMLCPAIEQSFAIKNIPGYIGEIPYEPVICDEPGITTAFTIDPATYGADEIQWTVSAGATVTELVTDGSSVSISYNGPGDYIITATPLNACGASASPKEFPVTVLDGASNNSKEVFGKNSNSTIASIVNTPRHLVVNSCEEILSDCGIQVNDVHLEVRFGILEGYYNSSPFSAYLDLQVKAYGADGVLEDYGNATHRLELDEDNPETAFIDGFHAIASDIRYFDVTVTGHSIDPALVDDITLEMSYEREVTHNMDYISVGSLEYDINGWDIHFSWAVNEACAVSTIKDFQLQVLKDEGGDPQWQEAVDIFVEGQTHYKMAMGQGSGKYLWRVRPIDNHPNGLGNKRNYREAWADGEVENYVHPEGISGSEQNDVNWIYSRTYTEGNRYSEQITYADGLQQVLQQQTRLNSMGHVVTTQTVQDHLGRNAVTSLPVPLEDSTLRYRANLFTRYENLPYEASHFDKSGIADTAQVLFDYYSASSFADNIPDDGAYPFTRTVYTTDGTNRVKEQTGVGLMHHDSTKTVKYYYGSVAQDELDNLFGAEAPLASNIQKTTVVDANGVSSVTYTDKAGKTIVTALTGEGNTTPGLEGLQTGASDSLGIIEEVITDDQRVSQYKRLISKQIVFPTGGTIDKIDYFLQPVKFSQDDCFGEELYGLCYSCDYRITVTAYHQEEDSLWTLYEDIVEGDKLSSCNDVIPYIQEPLGTRSFDAGTWVIEVTLETYTGDENGKFVDQNWAEVETQVRAGYDAVLAGIYADLDIYDYEAAYAKLDSLGADTVFTDDAETIGYYRLDVGEAGCPEYIEVPFYGTSCDFDCSTPSEFRTYFTDYVGAKYPEIPLMDGSDLLYAPGFTAFQLDAMLNNMVIEAGTNTWQDSEGNLIGCQQLWNAWIAEARAYGELYYLTGEANDQGYEVPGFLDRFIDRLGIVKTIWLPSSGTIPKSEYYKYFLFDQAIDEHCGCIQMSLDRTDCNISQSVFNGYTIEQRTNAFECIRALSSEPVTYAGPLGTHTFPNNCQIELDYYLFLVAKAQEAEENVKDQIKNRYSEIEALLHEHYENLYGTLYDSLYSACEIQSMSISVIDSLVSEVSLSVYSYLENGQCAYGIGTPEEQETIKRNLLYKIDFDCTNLRVTHLEDYNFNLNVHWEVNSTSDLNLNYFGYHHTGKIINWNDFLFTINDDKILRLDKKTGASLTYTLPANYRVKQDRLKGEMYRPQAVIDGDGNLSFVQYDYSLYSADPYDYKPIQEEIIVKLDKDLNFITSVTRANTNGLVESITGDDTYFYTLEKRSSEYKLIRWVWEPILTGIEIGTAPYADIIEIVNNKFLLFNDDKISYFDPSTGSMDFELLINSHYWKVINNKIYAIYGHPTHNSTVYEINLDGILLNTFTINDNNVRYRWDVVDDTFVFLQHESGAYSYRISTGEMLWHTGVYDQYYFQPFDIYIEDKIVYLNHGFQNTLSTTKFDLYRCNHDGFCFMQSESLPDSVAVDTIFSHNFALQSCEQVRSGHIANTISQQIEKLVEKKRQSFYEAYENTCMENIDHNLTLEYSLGYNQYTLYYYDRGGNLMKTVSPEGVKIDGSNDHDLVTRYEYNSMGQLTRQHSPDANNLAYNTANDATDESDKYFADFYYSDLGQLRYSQNAQQKVEGTYSYTRYDKLGRITEVGEAAGFDMQELRGNRNNMAFPSTGTDITKTVYSSPFIVEVAWLNNQKQENLRNRISYTHTEDNDLDNTNDTYTIYSYDPHGNVKWMVQKLPYLEKTFRIDYEYNLISGNVTQVVYNAYTGPGGNIQSEDEFRHRYTYDDDNRLKTVETSTDGHIWSAEARYEYYPHGPLKNVKLGHDPVHSSEYYYTLHGWIKGINMDRRIKGEGHVAAIYSTILNYYAGDYINTEVSTAMNTSAAYVATNSSDLYNGNISGIEDYFSGAGDASNSGRVFKYDELNRIMNSEFDIAGFGSSTLIGTTGYTYDRNGNLQTLNRTMNSTALDALAYTYESNRNRLTAVNDTGMDANNLTNAYAYDEIGNLTADNEKDIEWNVYGKVKAVVDKTTPAQKTEFFYDPSGNRVLKKQTNEAGLVTGTYYVRDASGNVMATYEQTGEGVERTLRLEEQPIYGSDRLGLYKSYKLMTFVGIVGEEPEAGWAIAAQDIVLNEYLNTSYLLEDGVTLTLGPGFTVDATAGETFEARPRIYEEVTFANEEPRPMAHEEVHHRLLGFKQYELKDHLGNVRAVISDRRTLEQGLDINNNTVSYYQGELMNYNHYYPFGMDMASWTSDNFDSYRYGFNGKEKDDKGEFGSQTTYDYGFRIYNPGIAKFLSVDPLTRDYPWYTPYQFAGNTPIWAIDLDGLEEYIVHSKYLSNLVELVRMNTSLDTEQKQAQITTMLHRWSTRQPDVSSKNLKIYNYTGKLVTLKSPVGPFRVMGYGHGTDDSKQIELFNANNDQYIHDQIEKSEASIDFNSANWEKFVINRLKNPDPTLNQTLAVMGGTASVISGIISLGASTTIQAAVGSGVSIMFGLDDITTNMEGESVVELIIDDGQLEAFYNGAKTIEGFLGGRKVLIEFGNVENKSTRLFEFLNSQKDVIFGFLNVSKDIEESRDEKSKKK